MPIQEVPHHSYIGEPPTEVLLQLEGNIANARPAAGADSCGCSSCISCPCVTAVTVVEDFFRTSEPADSGMGEMRQILKSIRSGLRFS